MNQNFKHYSTSENSKIELIYFYLSSQKLKIFDIVSFIFYPEQVKRLKFKMKSANQHSEQIFF